MSATISVVVPTYNSASVIANCLASLQSQRLAPIDVVVSDGGSTDGTVAIAKGFGATVIQGQANRSRQRNAGALAATGEYVVFIDADMRLTPGVLEECVASFRESDAALVIPEVDIGESFWARVRGFERSFYQDAWWLQAARCYRKSQFIEVRGFDVGLIGPEDWDLDERIRSFGSVRRIKATIEHDEGQSSLRSLLHKKTHYASSFDDFRQRHPERATLCFSRRRRIESILSQPSKVASHPLLAMGLLCLGATESLIVKRTSVARSSSVTEQPIDSALNPITDDFHE